MEWKGDEEVVEIVVALLVGMESSEVVVGGNMGSCNHSFG